MCPGSGSAAPSPTGQWNGQNGFATWSLFSNCTWDFKKKKKQNHLKNCISSNGLKPTQNSLENQSLVRRIEAPNFSHVPHLSDPKGFTLKKLHMRIWLCMGLRWYMEQNAGTPNKPCVCFIRFTMKGLVLHLAEQKKVQSLKNLKWICIYPEPIRFKRVRSSESSPTKNICWKCFFFFAFTLFTTKSWNQNSPFVWHQNI